MKALAASLVLALLATLNARAQGSVSFANNSATRVYLSTATGMTPLPVGAQYTAELVYAPDGTAPNAFSAAATRVGATITFGPVAGIFNGGGRTINTVTPAGGFGLFQVRVWSTSSGASWDQALASGSGQLGWSSIIRVDTGDPTTTPPGTPASLVSAGLTSFCVGPLGYGGPCVPEPSTVMLAFAAGGALLLLRNRRRS